MMMMMEPITYSTAGQQTDSGATIVYSAKEGMLLPLRRRHCSLIALLLLIATENHCRLRSGNVCGPLSPPESGGSACGAVIQSPGIPLSVRPPAPSHARGSSSRFSTTQRSGGVGGQAVDRPPAPPQRSRSSVGQSVVYPFVRRSLMPPRRYVPTVQFYCTSIIS